MNRRNGGLLPSYLCVIAFCITFQPAFSYDSLESAIRFHQSSQYPKALPIFIQLASKFKAKKDLSNYALCQTKIADIIRNYGGANIAIEMLEINERTIAVGLEIPSLVMAQNYLAKAEAFYNASNLADFKLAILKSIEIKRKAKFTDKYFTEDYLHLARYYKDVPNRNDSCYYWVKKSLHCAKLDKQYSLYIIPRIYNMLGYYFHPASEAYFKNKRDSLKNHYRLSRTYYDSAQSAILSQPVQDELMLGKIWHNFGNSFNNQGEIKLALSYYRKSIRIYEEFGNPAELAAKDWVVGKAFYRLGLYDSAITQFQHGIMRLVPYFKPKSLTELPALQPTLNDTWYTSHLVEKGNMYYQRYLAHGNQMDLTTAYDHYILLIKFNKYLVAKSLNENEQIHWSYLYGSNAYQLLVSASYDLLKKTGNKQYIQDAYGLIASAKYAFLNKGIIKPETSVSIKLSLLSEERDLVIKNVTRTISLLPESKLASLLPDIPNANEASSLSQIDLAKQFMDTLTFNNLVSELNFENAALIDFYFNGQDLYTIVISREGFDVMKSTLSSDLISSIKKMKGSLLEMSSENYSGLSNEIYRSTLDSALMLIPKGTNRLIISPDGVLQEIAWDALVTDTTNNKSFKSLNFLMNKYTIRTVMTPVQITRKSANSKDGYYGVAPDFQNSKRFSAIPFSTTLVSSKAEAFDGIFQKTITTEPIDANIFHIASHVTTDPIHPYNSTIHLGEMDSVTIADLSNARIKANLIILNGCQTGNGRYIQSEGTISIARAFYLLGAKSVLTTLWSVDDKATADVLKLFYENIEDDKELDIALREAKLDYISKTGSDESANPFYWAGLQLTGSANPIIKSNREATPFVIVLILITTILLTGFWNFRRRANAQKMKMF